MLKDVLKPRPKKDVEKMLSEMQEKSLKKSFDEEHIKRFRGLGYRE